MAVRYFRSLVLGSFILLIGSPCGSEPIEKRLCRARELQMRQLWTEAKDVYEGMISSSEPGSWSWIQGHLGVFDCIGSMKDPALMLETAREALAENAEYPEVAAAAALHLGETLQSQGEPMEALEYFRRVAREYPDTQPWYYWALFRIAHVCYDHSMDDEFFASVDKIIADYPERAERAQFTWACFYKIRLLRNMQSIEDYVDLLEFVLDSNPNMATGEDNTPDSHLDEECRDMLASYYESTENWSRGVRFANRILAKEDLHPRVRPQWESLRDSWLAKVNSRRDLDLDDALAADGRSGELESDLALALRQVKRGNAAYDMQGFDEALRRYQTAWDGIASTTHVRLLVAGWIQELHFLLGDEQKAFDFVRSLVNTPWDPGSEEQAEAAESVAEAAMSAYGAPAAVQWYCFLGGITDIDPTQPDASIWFTFSEAEEAIKESEASALERDAFLACLEFFADQSDWLSCGETMGLIPEKYANDAKVTRSVRDLLDRLIEDREEGQMILPAALEFAEAEPEILRLVGMKEYDANDYAGAIPHLRRYLEVSADPRYHPRVKLLLGVAYLENGETAIGRETLADLASNHPDSSEAPQARFRLAEESLSSEEYEAALTEFYYLLAHYPRTKEAKETCILLLRLPGDYFDE